MVGNIYNTDYGLVQFFVDSEELASAFETWAKKGFPDAKINFQKTASGIAGRAVSAIGAGGKHNFAERFSKSFEAWCKANGPMTEEEEEWTAVVVAERRTLWRAWVKEVGISSSVNRAMVAEQEKKQGWPLAALLAAEKRLSFRA